MTTSPESHSLSLPGECGELLRALVEQREQAVAVSPDLERSVPLPRTPWSPPETVPWSARRTLLHLIRERAQHAGHADIIRETLHGAGTTAQR
ncbi:DUF664 domain-containing protein [Streptomyces ficellus]|uniref:DUF664 domain-containing protein n=1 Tax=Streptomyces ficellus TaxID=1977088 RepID=A0ABT7Z711_9ACTN|nr:DUF664 domain-containing protein [Streptomyces ficellus]MDN3295255.1 DUF664 domain-containing protein [Streptomyces ficellus]